MKKTIVFMLVVLLLTACSTRERGAPLAEDASPDSVPNLEGDYAVNGFDLNEIEYGGRLVVTQGASPDEYELLWILTGIIQEGVGRINGNQLEVTWKSVEGYPNPVTGTASYTITAAGELYGVKRIDGFEGDSRETVYPNNPANMSK